jgi:hypothetical protein
MSEFLFEVGPQWFGDYWACDTCLDKMIINDGDDRPARAHVMKTGHSVVVTWQRHQRIHAVATRAPAL